MSPTTSLRPVPAAPSCPSWCSGESAAEATGSHLGIPVRLYAPLSADPVADAPLVTVRLGLGHAEEARGESPRLWLSAADCTAELDSEALGALIEGVERFALQLRGLRHRFENVICGGLLETVDHYPSPSHPLELVVPCPPWCQFRGEDEHNLTGLLRDYFHGSTERVMDLALQPLTWNKRERALEPETLELCMEHMPYAPLPQLDLTVGNSERGHHVALTFAEAGELRTHLNDLLALGQEYAPSDAPPTCQELVEYCGARILEHPFDAPGFYGHGVGSTRQGGPVWVTLPWRITPLDREDRITHLLADVHEARDELVAGDGGEFVQVGRPPGAPGPLIVADAA
ncbi:DUF6907 domain-containing protein [Streptomyces sp. NPDC050400]|uniref:DUF6907 domain-containing protein n=1 Tax=Streptomyces sp. NPDC050400 TaxID=3365610 RepID=UPI0037B3314B